jgi:hypothetical protein
MVLAGRALSLALDYGRLCGRWFSAQNHSLTLSILQQGKFGVLVLVVEDGMWYVPS